MALTPKSYDEIDQMKRSERVIFEKGEYDFEVFKAEQKTSKTGNQMIAVVLKVFGPGGEVGFVNDWLVDSPNSFCQHKIRTFCDTCNIQEVDEFCKGACGKVALVIESSDEYGEQNKVYGYVCEETKETPAESTMPSDIDVPF